MTEPSSGSELKEVQDSWPIAKCHGPVRTETGLGKEGHEPVREVRELVMGGREVKGLTQAEVPTEAPL